MRSRGVMVLAGLLLVLSGCGVAGETGVIRDGEAARRGVSSDNPDVAVPHKREQSNGAAQLVANYLRAAAGDREHAVQRVREFLQPGIRGTFNPSPQIVVVRQLGGLVASPRGASFTVPVELQPVGVLTEQGEIEPLGPGESAIIKYTFEVSPGEAGQQPGLYVNHPPPYARLLLSTTALAPAPAGRADQDNEELYRPHLLYFWDNESQALVPDLRYLPRSTEAAQRPTEAIRRLMAGPSEWLRPAVQAPPAETEVRGKVVVKDGRMVVDLNAKAAAPGAIPPEKLLAQLRWSLWDWHRGPIILQIEGQEKASGGSSGGDERENPAATLTPTSDMFCIADGEVLAECTDRAVREAPVILRSDVNRDVLSAAISRRGGGTYAALVRATGNNRTLFVGRAGNTDSAPSYLPTSLTAASVSRPVWLNRADSPVKGLIAADGHLYWFDSTGKFSQLPAGVSGIQAVAAAPDARRIAFIAGGAVYVAPLSALRGALTIGRAQRLTTSVGGLTAVGFSRPERLVVAGTGWLAELSVDGAIEEPFGDALGASKVSALAAHPDNPENGSARGAVLIEVADVAYQVFATQLQAISWHGPPPGSPPPGGPKSTPRVTAAFFEG